MSFWNLKKSKALKPTKFNIWKIPLNARKPFKDSDKDKVIDIFDCKPYNKKKQGEEHESVEEALKKVRLRKGREGTIKEQMEARKEHNIQMRKMNKEAREAGYGGGMKQAVKEMKEEEDK